jgi:hypothetical protein
MDADEDTELTLSAITCYECSEEDPKANKCPNRKPHTGRGGQGGCGGRGFSGNCNNCGKAGHRAVDCWEKAGNAEKRPANYAPRGEISNANVDGGVEFLLMAKDSQLTVPNDQSFLTDPNVWIADTAATVHTTPHKQGSVNMRLATREDSITVGNGSSEKASEIANIPGIICYRNGNEPSKGTLQDVTLLPTGKFNLFSLLKILKQGWKIGGGELSIRQKKANRRSHLAS